jgi:DNA-directed RNA polymerase subunit E'/Rpb7
LENAFIGVVLNFPVILNACSVLCSVQFSAITVDPIRTEKLCGTVWECQK